MWRTILLKVNLVLHMVYQQTKLKYLLGQDVCDRLFGQTLPQPILPPQLRYRFINGQAVGKSRPPGEGKMDKMRAQMDPAMCQHPTDKMKPRGNRGDKWWICTACLSRWDRLDHMAVNTINDMNLADRDRNILQFGKHMGSTFLEVYQQDPEYCRWIVQTVDQGYLPEGPTSENHLQFSQYFNHKALEDTWESDNLQYWTADLEQQMDM